MAVPVGDEFKMKDASGFPILLNWPERQSECAPWDTYLPVQRAIDKSSGELLQGSEDWDCNDYLVDGGSRALYRNMLELRSFLSVLYAIRRSRIFANDLNDRMYNVWLPPGLLRSSDHKERALVLLPFVTRVRQPFRTEFRETTSIHFILAPVSFGGSSDAERTRRLTIEEIAVLVGGTKGSSTHVPKDARTTYSLIQSPLRSYLDALVQDPERLTLRKIRETAGSRWCGTLRAWIEIVTIAIEEPIFRSDHTRRHGENQGTGSLLAQEVLNAIRLSSAWSVLVVDPNLNPFDFKRSRIVDNFWWPESDAAASSMTGESDDLSSGVPSGLDRLLRAIVGEKGFPAASRGRIDDVNCGVPAAMTWGIPDEQCVVTAVSQCRDRFPGESALNMFGWVSQSLAGIVTARAMIGAMANDAARLREQDVVELAGVSYLRTLELEELFDLNTSWPEYGQFYRNIRSSFGLDRMYERAKQRSKELSQHAEVVTRARQDETLRALQWVAAVLTIGILAIGVLQIFADHRNGWAWLALIVAIVATGFLAGLIGWVRWHPFRRRHVVK